MPKYLTIAEAQQHLVELSNQLTDEPAIITKDGKPIMITFGLEQFESLIETIEIISDKEFMAELKQGIQEAEQGATHNFRRVEKRASVHQEMNFLAYN